jgi:O-acetyl-ADP-ribose deacetylase (regulator of RNase III)
MINYSEGNLLDAQVDALVNTVNTQGVMGKGIALQFRQAFPEMFKSYADACKSGLVELGKMDIYDRGGLADGPRWIINFPTKGHWKAKSRIADIEDGLVDLVATVKRLGIRSIAIPPLGCGYGGLNWTEVRPLIERAFEALPEVNAKVYAPGATPSAVDMPNATEVPKMTVGRAALVALVRRYLDGLLDPYVSLLEVHKLMYFMQEAGQNLRLSYQPHIYGPYALELRQVMTKLEGHFLTGWGEGADTPTKIIELLPPAVEKADEFLKSHPEVLDRMDRVAKLIEGYEDPYGMELLSSVHWVMCNDVNARDSVDAAIAKVHSWNERKRRLLKPEHLRRAWFKLKDSGWDREARSAIH